MTRSCATLIAAAGLGLAACEGAEREAPPAAPAPAPAPSPPPQAAPASPPAAPRAADAARGAALYQTYCASCHGPGGDGDGPTAVGLDPKPARHSDGAKMSALSNEYLIRVVREGGQAVGKSPLMAPWAGTLDDAQIRDVVAFVRSLAKPPYTGPPP